MSLNSPAFLFIFLPLFLLAYTLTGKRWRNPVLMVFSALFLLWSDPLFAPLLILLVCLNFIFLRQVQKPHSSPNHPTGWLGFAIGVNLVILLAFKVLATYGMELLPSLETSLPYPIQKVFAYLLKINQFPLGLSFLAFQAINMLVDASQPAKQQSYSFASIFNFLIAFPKLISGPILRFRQVIPSFEQRPFHSSQMAAGIRRFLTGFVKKTIIADQLALITDGGIFNQPPAGISTGIAWLAIIAFTLQIYIDFSAYTDMAIGLGQVMGFSFPENFNYPYVSTSITEFWRRWHITLSGWFRDHVFYPLERKRRFIHWLTQPINTMIVFVLTGLWHGITPTFIFWGLLQGAAISVERTAIGKWKDHLWLPIRHGLTLLTILLGWVFFRSPSLPHAWGFLQTLVGIHQSTAPLPFSVLPPLTIFMWFALIAGTLLSFPILPAIEKYLEGKFSVHTSAWRGWLKDGLLLALFILGIIFQAGTSYQPFIYGGF